MVWCMSCNRKVLREAASGGRDAERVKLKLEIKVDKVWRKVGSMSIWCFFDAFGLMLCSYFSYFLLGS